MISGVKPPQMGSIRKSEDLDQFLSTLLIHLTRPIQVMKYGVDWGVLANVRETQNEELGETYNEYIYCHMHNTLIMRLKANTEDIHAYCSLMHEDSWKNNSYTHHACEKHLCALMFSLNSPANKQSSFYTPNPFILASFFSFKPL